MQLVVADGFRDSGPRDDERKEAKADGKQQVEEVQRATVRLRPHRCGSEVVSMFRSDEAAC